ncbi:MAG: hypothetical protein GY835_13610 [bacterium]|nr:hypothetical protein [bacterium]
MFREIVGKGDLLNWPVVGLLIFMMIFAGVVAFMLLGLRDKRKLDEIAALPFAPETVEDNHTEGGAGNER